MYDDISQIARKTRMAALEEIESAAALAAAAAEGGSGGGEKHQTDQYETAFSDGIHADLLLRCWRRMARTVPLSDRCGARKSQSSSTMNTL